METKEYEELRNEALRICEEKGIIFPQNKNAFALGFIEGYMSGYQAMLDNAEKIISNMLKPRRPSFPDAETR